MTDQPKHTRTSTILNDCFRTAANKKDRDKQPLTRFQIKTDVPSLVTFLHQLVEVFLHVFEDEEERLIFTDDLLQFHDVLVAQLFQRLRTTVTCVSNINLLSINI